MSQRQEHVRQVWGRSDVSLRSYSVSKFRRIEFTKNISDLVSQRQEHVRQVWGRSDVSLRSYSVSKFPSIEFTKNISDLVSQRQEHVRQVWGRSDVSLRSYSVSKFPSILGIPTPIAGRFLGLPGPKAHAWNRVVMGYHAKKKAKLWDL